MTTVNGTFAQCNNKDISFHFECAGRSCQAFLLAGFPDCTCTNTTQNTVIYTNSIKCSGPSTFTSELSFSQFGNDPAVNLFTNNSLGGLVWTFQRDDKSDPIIKNISTSATGNSAPTSTTTPKKSSASRARQAGAWSYFLWTLLAVAAIAPCGVHASVWSFGKTIEPGLEEAAKKFINNLADHYIDSEMNKNIVDQLEDAVCQSVADLVTSPPIYKAALIGCVIALDGITAPIPPLELAAQVWAGVTCNLILSNLIKEAKALDKVNEKTCNLLLGRNDHPSDGKPSSSPSSSTTPTATPTPQSFTSADALETSSKTSRPSSSASTSISSSATTSSTSSASSASTPGSYISSPGTNNICANCYLTSYLSHGKSPIFAANVIAMVVCAPSFGMASSSFCMDLCKKPCQFYDTTEFLKGPGAASISGDATCDSVCGDHHYEDAFEGTCNGKFVDGIKC